MHSFGQSLCVASVAVCSHCDVQQCAVHQLVGTTRCGAASRSMRHRARLARAWHAALAAPKALDVDAAPGRFASASRPLAYTALLYHNILARGVPAGSSS